MEVFRLARRKYGLSLSGVGAAKAGGRWNSRGVEMIYTAGNRSLAMAEVAVHFSINTLPADYFMLTISIPEQLNVEHIDVQALPPKWAYFPHVRATQLIGDSFAERAETAVIKVPSVVTQGDYNYLINPAHKDFQLIEVTKAERFPFDRRIFQQ